MFKNIRDIGRRKRITSSNPVATNPYHGLAGWEKASFAWANVLADETEVADPALAGYLVPGQYHIMLQLKPDDEWSPDRDIIRIHVPGETDRVVKIPAASAGPKLHVDTAWANSKEMLARQRDGSSVDFSAGKGDYRLTFSFGWVETDQDGIRRTIGVDVVLLSGETGESLLSQDSTQATSVAAGSQTSASRTSGVPTQPGSHASLTRSFIKSHLNL